MLNRMHDQGMNRNMFPGAVELSLSRGRFLFRAGDPFDDTAWLVLDGIITLELEGPGDVRTIALLLGPGELVGASGFLRPGQAPRRASARSLGKSRVLCIRREDWERARRMPGFENGLLGARERRIRLLERAVRRLGMPRAVQRVAMSLLELPEWRGHQGASEIVVRIPVHADLARLVNCTRERVTRMLGDLNAVGAIASTGTRGVYRLHRQRLWQVCETGRVR